VGAGGASEDAGTGDEGAGAADAEGAVEGGAAADGAGAGGSAADAENGRIARKRTPSAVGARRITLLL
jgi:hypothetical protein